jgi:triosephosphate isomerase (TIM)
MTRKPLIAGNWKMNLSLDRAVALSTELAAHSQSAVDVAVIPPYPWIVPVKQALGDSPVSVGAQNCYWEPAGAYTGEVSAAMLAGVCDFILAGHSERRHVFGEGDVDISRKVLAILDAGIKPILCVGETIDERQSGHAEQVVSRQLTAGLSGVSGDDAAILTIAYEPVWAIGTGVAATSEDAQGMCALIRAWLLADYGEGAGDIRILYGGSMTPDNAADLLAQKDVDGGLVGGASLTSQSFLGIVAAADSVLRM